MCFEEDGKLLGLFRRYSDPSEAEELQSQVIAYIRSTEGFDMQKEVQ